MAGIVLGIINGLIAFGMWACLKAGSDEDDRMGL